MTHLPQPSHSFSVAAPTTVSLGNQRSSCLQTRLSLLTHQSQASSLFSTSLKTFEVGGWCACEGNVKTLPHWVRHIEHVVYYSSLDGFIFPLHFIWYTMNFFSVLWWFVCMNLLYWILGYLESKKGTGLWLASPAEF